ncbi:MAG: HAD family phosphatase [Parcubacteria group bacterium]|jgi:putative hydrolase of the HAD superfamily
MYKAIIFDFGGIFSMDDDIKEFWKNNATKLKIDPQEANETGIPIWLEARIGKIDSNMFWEKLGPLAGMSAVEFKRYFIGYTGFRDELLDYVKNNLRGKYKLAILSNQIESWLEPILEEKKFREIFEVIVTSYETGFAKPDLEIYKKTLEKLDVQADGCIYIDDMIKNLEPAKALGMKTIEFKNYNQCIEDLEKILGN